MPGKIFFRDGHVSVTSTEVMVGQHVFPISEILSARAIRRRALFPLLQPNPFALLITTAAGEMEVFRARNGYVVFQLEKAIEGALRTAMKGNSIISAHPASSEPSVVQMPEAVAETLNSVCEDRKLAS